MQIAEDTLLDRVISLPREMLAAPYIYPYVETIDSES